MGLNAARKGDFAAHCRELRTRHPPSARRRFLGFFRAGSRQPRSVASSTRPRPRSRAASRTASAARRTLRVPRPKTCASGASDSSRTCRKPTARRCWISVAGRSWHPCWKGGEREHSAQQGLKKESAWVLMVKLCQWLGGARRTTYYKSTRSPAKVKPVLGEPIKETIEAEPLFCYRTVAALPGMNKNTVQWLFQRKGWREGVACREAGPTVGN